MALSVSGSYLCFLGALMGLVLIDTSGRARSHEVTPLPKACKFISSTFVDCRRCSLHTVPDGIPETVETLLLSHNTIHHLSNESFRGLVNLQRLELDYNSVSKLRANFFQDQGRLTHLILHHNQIGKLANDVFVNTPNLEVLDLSFQNNGLTKIPVALHAVNNLRVLNISSNRIISAQFPTDVYLPSLEVLRLAKNKISTLQDGDFSALTHAELLSLDTSGNPITEVGSHVFQPLHSVEDVDLSDGFTPDAIPALTLALSNVQLRTLHLNKIGLKVWNGDNFRSLQNSTMETLDLSFNNLTTLDSSFPGLENITHLDLKRNQIMNISGGAFTGLQMLQVLDLSNNSITTIVDGMFSSLSTTPLGKLYLNSNNIKSIAATNAFKGLSRLTYLKISKNKIYQTLKGGEFAGLDALEVLDLGVNKNISLAADAFRNVPTLQILYLNLAGIKKITARPSSFGSLHVLQKLDLSNNNMAALDEDVFSNLSSIETLYLQHNNLYNMWNISIHVHFLKGLRTLRYINLCFNGFRNIPNNTFNDLTQLETLLLCRNMISHFEDNIFDGLQLRTLDLGYNQINLINQTLLKPILPTLNTLSVPGNPFSCTCELRWFRNWLDTTKTRVNDLKHSTCSSPPDMRGELLTSFHPETLNCDHKLPLYAWILVGVGSATLLLTLAVVVKFRWYCTYYYHLINLKRKKYTQLEGEDRPFRYDAFVSFCHVDKEWVEHELIPNLEEKDHFRLCIHERDFRVGARITDNVVQAVNESRFTLCLVSDAYLDSEWCRREREFAMANMCHRDVLIIVLLGEIPREKLTPYYKLHKVMKKRTYLPWPPEEGKKRGTFWLKLKTVLKDPNLRVNNNIEV